MGTTPATSAPLRPQGQREQNQAKRRYPQPAPHTSIIAQFSLCFQGPKTRQVRPKSPPSRGYGLPTTPSLALLLALGLPSRSGFCLRFTGRLRGFGRFRRLLDRRSLGWLTRLCHRCRLRRSHGFFRGQRLRRRRRLHRRSGFQWGGRCRSRRNFSLRLSTWLAASHSSSDRNRTLGSSAPFGWWRWWRRRRRRRQRLQELQNLRPRTHLAIQQQHEHVVGDLRIRRHLRRDPKFRHLRQRNLLLHLSPLGKEILDLLRHCLLPRRDREKQDHLGARRRQQLPGPRWRGRFFTRQSLSQAVGVRIQILPGLNQILARNRPA